MPNNDANDFVDNSSGITTFDHKLTNSKDENADVTLRDQHLPGNVNFEMQNQSPDESLQTDLSLAKANPVALIVPQTVQLP